MLGALDVVPEWGFALTSPLRQSAGETVFSSHADIHRSGDRTTATQRSPHRREADLGLFSCRLTAESAEGMLLSPHSSVQIRCAGRGHAGDSAAVWCIRKSSHPSQAAAVTASDPLGATRPSDVRFRLCPGGPGLWPPDVELRLPDVELRLPDVEWLPDPVPPAAADATYR